MALSTVLSWKMGNFGTRPLARSEDISGRAIAGPLAGVQLEAIPSRVSFWFAIVAAVPGVELHDR